MILWWIGNAIFLLVVIPVVVVLLQRLLRPVTEIRRYVDDARDHGLRVSEALRGIEQLPKTPEHARALGDALRGYAAALDRLP